MFLITHVSLFHLQQWNVTRDENVTRLSFKCTFPLFKLSILTHSITISSLRVYEPEARVE